MKRFVKYVLTVVIFTGWMGAAQASLIFDFTFTNSANGGGVVIGEILGLENNSSGMASGVNIIRNSAGFGVGSYSPPSSVNYFTVSNYMLTSYIFISFGVSNTSPYVTDSTFWMRVTPNGDSQQGFTNHQATIFVRDDANFTATLRSVPEPHTAVLVILGLAGLGFSRYKKQH